MKDKKLSDEQRLALAALARTDRAAFAEVITEYIDPVFLSFDLMGQFMNTREMNFGEILVKRFEGKYHVQQIVPGQITLSEQVTIRDKATSIALDILSAKAGYNTLELEHGGPQFTPEHVRNMVQKSLTEALLMRTWNALGNIWTTANATALTIDSSGTSNFLDASGPLTASVLDEAIDHVNYWAEGVRSIIGTEQALAPLSEFAQYQIISGSTNDFYVTQNGTPEGTIINRSPYGGQGVETYRGVTNIVRLRQIFDRTEYPPKPLLPNDFVLVVGDNVGEFITYGGPQYKEFVDNEPTPPYWNYETWIQFGMMIHNAKGIVKIKVTPGTTP